MEDLSFVQLWVNNPFSGFGGLFLEVFFETALADFGLVLGTILLLSGLELFQKKKKNRNIIANCSNSNYRATTHKMFKSG